MGYREVKWIVREDETFEPEGLFLCSAALIHGSWRRVIKVHISLGLNETP